MMKLNLLTVATGIFPMVLFAQTNIPPGADQNTYSACMNEILPTGRPYAETQRFCYRRATPSNLNQENYIYSMPANDLISQFSDHHLNVESRLDQPIPIGK